MDKSVIVSVRLPDAELRKLQLLAQVYEQSVGELIRVAVSKHVEDLTRTEEFKTRALELKKRNEETINELLDPSAPAVKDTKVVHTLPRLVPSSHTNKRSSESPRPETVSFVRVQINQPAQLGAAASHRTTKPATSRQFTIVWTQDGTEWRMDGKNNEVELTAAPTGAEPAYLTWRNIRTAASERFELRASEDGRVLIEIPFTKALLRAEALRDVDEAERSTLIPTVHTGH